jgi:CYRIA/CYRIB Rac1 binding domain
MHVCVVCCKHTVHLQARAGAAGGGHAVPVILIIVMFVDPLMRCSNACVFAVRIIAIHRMLCCRPELVRQAVGMLSLVLEWDQAKMMHPQLQNDFAFYKRLMPRMVAAGDFTVSVLLFMYCTRIYFMVYTWILPVLSVVLPS